MPNLKHLAVAIGPLLLLAACGSNAELDVANVTGPNPQLAAPTSSWLPNVDVADVVGWQEGEAPTPANGLQVAAFARGLDHPRWLYVLPNGDVLVAESAQPPREGGGISGWIQGRVMTRAGANVPSANRITILRDTNGDGVADLQQPFITGLNSPFGMALVGTTLYVANADSLVAFSYQEGATSITAAPRTVAPLPGGRNHHWTKSLIASPDGSRLYVGVGSNSNIGENGLEEEQNRAAILEIDPANGATRIYASGLRNPVGMDWNPESNQLWVAVNERDEIGGDLPPDYMTAVRAGGFYGWPWSYWGSHVDTRVEPANPQMVSQAIQPDYALGPHTASLGLTFVRNGHLGPGLSNGAFIGQHGSWNRTPMSGYKVVFVPFANGRPNGAPVDILTGFLNADQDARGRPVGVIFARDGSLLVADDVGNIVWRVFNPSPTSGRRASHGSEGGLRP